MGAGLRDGQLCRPSARCERLAMAGRVHGARAARRQLAYARGRKPQRRARRCRGWCACRRRGISHRAGPRDEGEGRAMRHAWLAAVLLLTAPAALPQTAPAAAPRDCTVCPDLALVPPGQFQMGSAPDAVELDPESGESPPVALSFSRPFLISSREITVGEFRRFVEATGAKAVPGCRVWAGKQWIQDRDRSWRDPGFAVAPRDCDPVVCVSWDDA